MTATIRRVSRPRGELTADQRRRYIRAENKLDDAKDELRRVVLAILAEGASFAEMSKETGLSTNTLQRWSERLRKHDRQLTQHAHAVPVGAHC